MRDNLNSLPHGLDVARAAASHDEIEQKETRQRIGCRESFIYNARLDKRTCGRRD
jgi:hypothetical protein